MDLKADDYVGVSFWIISAAMVAATYFFTVERDRAVGKWKTSLTVAALVCGIAAIHYFYMRGVWVSTGESPLVFRYVDWLLTVPLQIIEFYLILAAIAVVRGSILEANDRVHRDAGLRFLGRAWRDELLACVRYRNGWLALHYLRDLRR
jgi:bacteriorhodopsin